MSKTCYICGNGADSLCSVCDRPVCDEHVFRKEGSIYAICRNCHRESWILLKELPEELKDALFSDELTDTVYDICRRNGIEDDLIGGIVGYIGLVCFGIKSPEQLQGILEKGAKLEKGKAETLAQEILSFYLNL